MSDKVNPVIVQLSALLSIGELLDELICVSRGFSIDEQHLNFGRKLLKHIEGQSRDAGSNQEKD